jgi:hypothetical protein
MTDDSTIGPLSWDQWLSRTIAGYPGRLVIVSGEHSGADYVNFVAMGREMVEAIGWFALPNVIAWCWDTCLELIGDATAIVYAKPDEMSFNHRYEVTKEPIGDPKTDCYSFLMWCVQERKRIVYRVRQKINEAKSQRVL